MAAGTVFMTVVGCFLNAFVLLPAYAKAFGMPIDGLVGMGTAVNKHITDLKTFVILAVGPFNLLKGILAVSYTHLRAHETDSYLVCRLLLEKKKNTKKKNKKQKKNTIKYNKYNQ